VFDTPAKRAKVFFDHEARGDQGAVQVEHKILKQSKTISDASLAAELNKLVTTTDWQGLKRRTRNEEPSEGGTEFRFSVKVGDKSVDLRTSEVGQYPELVGLLDALKEATGAP